MRKHACVSTHARVLWATRGYDGFKQLTHTHRRPAHILVGHTHASECKFNLARAQCVVHDHSEMAPAHLHVICQERCSQWVFMTNKGKSCNTRSAMYSAVDCPSPSGSYFAITLSCSPNGCGQRNNPPRAIEYGIVDCTAKVKRHSFTHALQSAMYVKQQRRNQDGDRCLSQC